MASKKCSVFDFDSADLSEEDYISGDDNDSPGPTLPLQQLEDNNSDGDNEPPAFPVLPSALQDTPTSNQPIDPNGNCMYYQL